jgi:predicted AAA+ superfamily ATPase
MERFGESNLVKWIKRRRRKPLILRGARQVGKSTLVRQFAEHQGLLLNEINLERHLELNKVFAALDTAAICSELEALKGRSVTDPGSLLFLDEIQATPAAVQALRYFYEDLPRVPVIAAGSLLEFTLADHSFSMPVGRIEYHHLGPMTFHEFLQAIEPQLCRYLNDLSFDSGLPDAAHRKLLNRQRQYLFVGGMPEAVLEFQEGGSLVEASTVHRRIVSTYEDDFAKYARHSKLTLLQRIFRLIPRQVGQKVKYVNLSREDRSRDVREAIELLSMARVCHRVFASHCSGIPLHADINQLAYKLLFLDVGLMNHLCGMDWRTLSRMNDVQLVNEGAVAEQYVGQHLAFSSRGIDAPNPVYWLREGKSTNAEVDYVVSQGPKIFPIEVKAGRSGTLRSLHQFIACGKSKKALRFDTNPPSRHKVECHVPSGSKTRQTVFELLSLPLYAIDELGRLLAQEHE